jgi:hypothetical protein
MDHRIEKLSTLLDANENQYNVTNMNEIKNKRVKALNVDQSNLKRHKKLHTGEKPIHCKVGDSKSSPISYRTIECGFLSTIFIRREA